MMIVQRKYTVEFVWFKSPFARVSVLSDSDVSYADAYQKAYTFALESADYKPAKWWEVWRWFGESKPPQGV